ncbi:glycerophosphodiester phosphodiesterase [Bacillota bacterium Lsc_1132]
MVPSTKVFAHRGFSGNFPENTMIAFKEAGKFDIAGIELDVQLTKDGEMVVIHDEQIDRTTNGRGFVKDYTYEQLLTFDAGSWFHPNFHEQKLPKLSEILGWMKEREKPLTLNIELKNDQIHYEGLEEKVLNLIEEYQLKDQIILSSFHYESLVKIRELDKRIPIGFLIQGIHTTAIENAKKIGAHIHCDATFALSGEGKRAKEAGLEIRVYTINDADEFINLEKAGADVIMTDFPDQFA